MYKYEMSTANGLPGFTKSQMEITPNEMSIVRSAIKILKEEEEKEEKDHLMIGLLNKYIEFVKAFNGGNNGYQFIPNVDAFHSYDCKDNEYCNRLKTYIITNSALSRNRSKQAAAAAPHYNLQRMNLNPPSGGKWKVSKKSRKSKSRKSKKSKKTKSRRH
jgi:hypothetical protein